MLYPYVACHLPSTTVIVTWFTEAKSGVSSSVLKVVSTYFLIEVNMGSLGNGRFAVSLSSISTTADMVGLESAESCTHNNPTCMHLTSSDRLLQVSAMEGSMRSSGVFAFQRFHA